MTHYNACLILGISPNANIEDIKKAYLNACKLYHPDNVGSEIYLNEFNNCQDAYNYLVNEYENRVLINNSITNKPGKVLGSANKYSYNHKDYLKKQQQFRKKSEEKKIRNLNEIIEKSKELKNNSQAKLEPVTYKAEDDVLNQIRWLRVAKIIHDTIEADKLKGDN